MKSNIYYKKDKKCRLIKSVSTQNSYGQWVSSYQYATPGEIWCYANQLSQSQTFEAKTYGDDETRIFVFERTSKSIPSSSTKGNTTRSLESTRKTITRRSFSSMRATLPSARLRRTFNRIRRADQGLRELSSEGSLFFS